MITDHRDDEKHLIEQVQVAGAKGTTLAIRGGNTKAFVGNPVQAADVLTVSSHCGIVAYEPTELALTVRAGTALAAVESLLAEQGQMLAFEPPHFGPGATVGGMIATGLSGPRRPWAGSVRDSVLGVRLLNGKSEVMRFGGQVMKNVAGYDLSRLMVGALGVLGVLLEVSLKVMPIAPDRITLVQERDQSAALALMEAWAGQALPITATAWCDGRLWVRIEGSEEALRQTREMIGGEALEPGRADAWWRDLREQRFEFFAGDQPLWRCSVRPATPAEAIPAVGLIEWGGALRWLRTASDDDPDLTAARVRALAAATGGHASLFRAGAGGEPTDGVFAPLDPVRMRLHQNLKHAFDPAGLFNPGRLYSGMEPAPGQGA